MKYVIVLGDGMADEPIEAAGGKTPLQLADKPVMDEMAKVSEQGIAYTVPSNLPAGSDVANLSMLGYDPQVYYSGRSPLEALSIGVDMKDTDIALRCNVVTVSEDEDYEDKTIIDHSAGEITSDSSCRCGGADRQCTAGSARPGSAGGHKPGTHRSSGCGWRSSSSAAPSFRGLQLR